MNSGIPLMVEFVAGSKIRSEVPAESPDAWVQFGDGSRVAVPADQVVLTENRGGSARVGFGGMTFEGIEDEKLVFWRVRDLLPEELLSPSRSDKLSLDPQIVKRVVVNGNDVWPRA